MQIKTSSKGKKIIKLSKSEWLKIGQSAGWNDESNVPENEEDEETEYLLYNIQKHIISLKRKRQTNSSILSCITTILENLSAGKEVPPVRLVYTLQNIYDDIEYELSNLIGRISNEEILSKIERLMKFKSIK